MLNDLADYHVEARPAIVSGAIVLWKGTGIISRLVRLFSEYSHASLVVRLRKYVGLKDRVFLVEALAQGLQLRLLSTRLSEYSGHADLLIPELTPEQSLRIAGTALLACADCISYDYTGLFKNILGRVSTDAHALFCSEFVDLELQDAGVPRKVNAAVPLDKAPRPGDLPKLYPGKIIKLL